MAEAMAAFGLTRNGGSAMAIKLIGKDEKELCAEIDGTEFFYKRLHGSKRKYLIKKHTKRGNVDWMGVIYDGIRECVTRTNNLEDADGKTVQWEPDYAEGLPDNAVEELGDLIGANKESGADAAKNLPNTSGSSTTTKA